MAEKELALEAETFRATPEWVKKKMAEGLRFDHSPALWLEGSLVHLVDRNSYMEAKRTATLVSRVVVEEDDGDDDGTDGIAD